MHKLTVAICTYNRADILRGCLHSLVLQAAERQDFEVLVIDNNSTDATPRVVQAMIDGSSNFRYLREPIQGLSHARNRAWMEAKGKYIGYADDDCLLPKDWIRRAKEIVETISPGLFGGPYYPYYRSPKPFWFKDAYETHRKDRSGYLGKNEFLDGGNIFIRKDLISRMGGFSGHLGMSGSKKFYGEETLLQLRIREKLPAETFYYDPTLYVFHLVRPEKMTFRWNVSRYFNLGRSTYLAFENGRRRPAHRRELIKDTAGVLSGLCMNLGRGLLRSNRSDFPYVQNFHYERTLPLLVRLGRSFEQFKRLNESDRMSS